MSADVDILAAVRYELATYLRGYLAPLIGVDTDPASPFFGKSLVTVREQWPTANKRVNQWDVTVLATGEADDWYFMPPVKVSTVVQSPGRGLITYTYGRVEGLQLTLDCFATAPVHRNTLCQHMRRALNRPPYQTLTGLATPNYLTLGRSEGLVLALTKLFNTPCEFSFSPIGAPVEASESTEVGEWRATFRGGATFDIRDQELFTLIQRIGLTTRTGSFSQTKYTP